MQRLIHVITREQSTIGDGHRGMLALKELLKELKMTDSPKLQVADHFTKVRIVTPQRPSLFLLLILLFNVFLVLLMLHLLSWTHRTVYSDISYGEPPRPRAALQRQRHHQHACCVQQG